MTCVHCGQECDNQDAVFARILIAEKPFLIHLGKTRRIEKATGSMLKVFDSDTLPHFVHGWGENGEWIHTKCMSNFATRITNGFEKL